MAEKTASELLREQLAYKRKNGRLYSDESIVNAADSYCDGYKAFLDKAKTEREAAKAAMEMAKAAGFTEFEHGKKYGAGDRVFAQLIRHAEQLDVSTARKPVVNAQARGTRLAVDEDLRHVLVLPALDARRIARMFVGVEVYTKQGQ